MVNISICKGTLKPLFSIYSQTFCNPCAFSRVLGVPFVALLKVFIEGLNIMVRIKVIMKINNVVAKNLNVLFI